MATASTGGEENAGRASSCNHGLGLAVSATREIIPRRRVIVLGASNATRGLRVVLAAAKQRFREPIDLLAAIGNGRSYGIPARFLGRVLPGIRNCPLWEEWSAREPLPTTAVITDIGNDIVYGVSVPQILGWVRECAERLGAAGVETTVMGLPVEPITQLGPLRFRVAKAMIFPSSPLQLSHAVSSALELQAGVQALVEEFRWRWLPSPGEWYGLDPIHIRRRSWRTAWGRALGLENQDELRALATRGGPPAWYFNRLRPRRRWQWGREWWRDQPAWRGRDGSRLSLY